MMYCRRFGCDLASARKCVCSGPICINHVFLYVARLFWLFVTSCLGTEDYAQHVGGREASQVTVQLLLGRAFLLDCIPVLCLPQIDILALSVNELRV